MPDNDYNIIKPVESLQNIGALTPARRRKERKHRQNLHEQNEEERKKEPDESSKKEPNESSRKELNDKIIEDEADRHSIDYCA